MAFRLPFNPGPFPKREPKKRALAPGQKDREHLDLIRQCRCLACGTRPAEAAHIRFSDARAGKANPGFGAKPHDRWTVPLCPRDHRLGRESQHGSGDERAWWEARGIDPHEAAAALWEVSSTGRAEGLTTGEIVDRMEAVILKARRFG